MSRVAAREQALSIRASRKLRPAFPEASAGANTPAPAELGCLGDVKPRRNKQRRLDSCKASSLLTHVTEEDVGKPKSLPGANPSQGAEEAKRITGNDFRRTCFGEGLEQAFRKAGPPPYACAVDAGLGAESLGWEERD